VRITIYSKTSESIRGRKTVMSPVRFRTETDGIGITITATEAYEMDGAKRGELPVVGHRDLWLKMTWADVNQFVEAVQEMIVDQEVSTSSANNSQPDHRSKNLCRAGV